MFLAVVKFCFIKKPDIRHLFNFTFYSISFHIYKKESLMNQQSKRITIMTIGQTGAGKSAFGNVYLEKEAFETSDDPDSCTRITSSAENIVNGKLRTYIDTQGLDDTEGVDDKHAQQMVDFLRSWEHGVNAIGIVINGQSPRLDQGTKKLLKLIHVLINSNEIWNYVFLVFTKWYKEEMTEKNKASRRKFADEVRKIANECIGRKVDPQIPCFFVNAKSDLSKLDDDTKQEIININAFAYGNKPISTKGFQVPDVNYFKLITETKENVFIKEEINERALTRTRTYANQTRNKQIAYNGEVSYSDWVNTKTWTKVDRKTIREETQNRVKVNEVRNQVYEKHGSRRYLVAGPKKQKYVGTDVTTTYEDRKRNVITDYDGNVSYGEWVTIRTYTETNRVP